MTVPLRSTHTNGLVAYLDTLAACEKGAKPPRGGWAGAPGISEFVRYLIVHSITGGELDGPLGDPHADAEMTWQVNSYGPDQDAAEELADTVRAGLLAHPLPAITIANRSVVWIESEGAPGAAQPDTDRESRTLNTAQPSIWWCFERFRILTVPT